MTTATKPAPQKGTHPPAVPVKADWMKPTNKAGLDALAPLVSKELERALPGFLRGQADRLIRCLITETQKNPALMDCTPASLFGCCIQAGQLGLTIGGPLGHAYLIPFGNTKKGNREAQLIVGYKGFVDLAHRSDKVRRITPRVVREGDAFEVRLGVSQDIRHTPVRNNFGKPTDYYVVIELANGGTDFETFTFDEAIRHRDRYSTTRTAPDYVRAKSPWYEVSDDGVAGPGFDAMALKTLVRKLAKRLPLSVEMSTAAELDEQIDRGEPQMIAAAVMPELLGGGQGVDEPQPHGDKADELRQRMERSRKPADPGDPDADPFATGEAAA